MKQQLNYSWYFIEGFNESYLKDIPETAKEIDIPHTVKLLPYNYFSELDYQGEFTYFKRFDVKEFNRNHTWILRFNAFMVDAKIYLNDNCLGEFVSGYIPVEIDISKYIKEKNNFLVVILSTKENHLVPPFGNVVDYMTFGGIYRGVELISHADSNYIVKSLVYADKKGHVIIKDLVSQPEKHLSIVHDIMYGNELIKHTEDNEFDIEEPKLWSIEEPNLYRLISRVYYGHGGVDVYETKFGFRTAQFKKNGFYLNGKRVKLIGLNRHQSYPYIGYAASKSLQVDDANILKYKAGVNLIRTSHYPQDEAFLSRCDEIGLLVLDEIPGWQYLSKDTAWREQHLTNVSSMVKEDFNHPSVIAHGVRVDESQDDHDLYEKSNKIAHDIDPYRQTLGVRFFKNSELLEDIYAYNDFSCGNLKHGLDKPKTIKKGKKPYIVSECIGHTFPTKSYDGEQRRIEHALRHALVINDANKYKEISAIIGWCAFDYNTHKDFGSGDRICYHGVFDIFRNRKYASYIYQSQQDKEPVMKVLCSFNQGDYDESIYRSIYVATNLDYIELYKNGLFVKKYTAKHSEFAKMKHPLIKVDDLIGETFVDARFNKNDQRKMAKLLSKVALIGLNNISMGDKLKVGKFMVKYHLKYPDLVDMFNAYVSSWGTVAKTYEFKGYKDGKLIKTEKFGPSFKSTLDVEMSKTELINEDTYDMLRISLRQIDEYKHVLNYSFMPIKVEVEGPIELMGPKEFTLVGGQVSMYIRSLNKKGEGVVKISSPILNTEIKINVN